NGKTLFGSGVNGHEYSEKVQSEIDAEVKSIMDGAFTVATDIITENKIAFVAIAKRLIEKESIERAEFEDMLREHNIVVKKKEDIEHAGV
ncbi:MAG: hypothetical protein JKX80_02350, partial [Candidatus Pacebacteria bacterium]|nr:hypothetical protein [Candidatus Paceibacterota bacterium]